MTRPLAHTVYLDNIRYDPGDIPPPEIAARITNPKAWREQDPVLAPAPTAEGHPTTDHPQAGGNDEQPPGTDGYPGKAPPRGGPGSAASSWAAYAKANGVDVTPNASRDDIIAALCAAGVPTE